MNRYFYKDPLAAAWMAKHFGMRFAVNPQVIQQHFDLVDIDAMDEDFQASATNGDEWLFFVHPDSLSLLEPREADLYACDTGCGWLATTPGESWKKQVAPFRIIQRNGIAFMWPESEAS